MKILPADPKATYLAARADIEMAFWKQLFERTGEARNASEAHYVGDLFAFLRESLADMD